MRGKKSRMLACGCCDCLDLREKQRLADERRARIDRFYCEGDLKED